MNQQQTIELWNFCEMARRQARERALAAGDEGKKADKIAHKAAKAVWNYWAETLLAIRKELEASDQWTAEKDKWAAEAAVDFSNVLFFCEVFVHQQELRSGEEKEKTPRVDNTAVKSISVEGDRVRFDGFIFPGEAHFEGSRFKGGVRFDEAHFFGVAEFESTIFFSDIGCRRTKFFGDAKFLMAKFVDYVSFDEAYFEQDADFSAIRGERGFSLANVTFKKVPDFIQAHFEEAPRLDNVTIGTTAPKKDGNNTNADDEADDDKANADSNDIETRFRALRRLAVQGYDHENERKFLKREIYARRGTKDLWWHLSFLVGLGYEWFSDFGGSISRPIIWGAGSVLAFAVIYFWIAPGACPTSCYNAFGQALFLSLKNAILLISWENVVDGGKALTCFKSPDKASIWPLLGFGAVQMLQKLWSAVLWFLLLLAVRNKFRIR